MNAVKLHYQLPKTLKIAYRRNLAIPFYFPCLARKISDNIHKKKNEINFYLKIILV